jgi:hypothetical protein
MRDEAFCSTVPPCLRHKAATQNALTQRLRRILTRSCRFSIHAPERYAFQTNAPDPSTLRALSEKGIIWKSTLHHSFFRLVLSYHRWAPLSTALKWKFFAPETIMGAFVPLWRKMPCEGVTLFFPLKIAVWEYNFLDSFPCSG